MPLSNGMHVALLGSGAQFTVKGGTGSGDVHPRKSVSVLEGSLDKGFEIAVKESQPMCLMTSYNLINGVHAANNYDICTVVAREEWGFEGLIMTDWTTTLSECGSIPHLCAKAGNDLIMPGMQMDHDEMFQAYESGELRDEEIRVCAARIINVILQTNAYEGVVPYHW